MNEPLYRKTADQNKQLAKEAATLRTIQDNHHQEILSHTKEQEKQIAEHEVTKTKLMAATNEHNQPEQRLKNEVAKLTDAARDQAKRLSRTTIDLNNLL